MVQTLQKSILLLIFSVLICCGVYPLALWVVGQTFFSFQSNGSVLLDEEGKPVGSLLIAQPFTKDEYFQPRPSAVAYNATASASSALAASNVALRSRVKNSLRSIAKHHNGAKVGELVPGDMVTTSGSGLDPHITMQNALYQLDRVASKWARDLKRGPKDVRNEIEQILNSKSSAPFGGLAGEKFINVLEVNLELRKRYGVPL